MDAQPDAWPSGARVLYICGLGSNAKGAKPAYLQQHFRHVCVPAVKHASYAVAKEALTAAVAEFKPDIVVGHSAGVGKALTLATSGAWRGPLLLLAGGSGCASVANLVGQSVTVVVPKKDPDAKQQRRAVKSCADPHRIEVVEVDDGHDLNTSLVDGDRLRHLILDTLRRHGSPASADGESDGEDGGEDVSAEERVKLLFAEADEDHDGYMSRADLEGLLDGLDASLGDGDLHRIVAAVSPSADGRIALSDFVNWAFSSDDAATKVLGETTALARLVTPAGRGDAAAPAKATAEVSVADGVAHAAADGAPVAPGAGPGAGDADAVASAEAELDAEDEVVGEGVGVDLPGWPVQPGQLFTWGRGSDGQLGQQKVAHPKPNCALPYPVRGLHNVVHVACGGGQQGCTAAVTALGQLFTFGNNFRGRLGHGEGPALKQPRLVDALADERVLMAACGTDHSGALVQGGRVFLWGGNRRGQLGRGHAEAAAAPAETPLPAPARQLDCEDLYSAAVLEDGRLYTWGCNGHGRLGLGHERDGCSPAEAQTPVPVAAVALGSLYAGAIGRQGELLMWGYGGHGNLGLGGRKSLSVPMRVPLDETAAQVACTRGQDGCKGGLNPTSGGAEGPHTVVLGASGALYTMGTCHKGLLCNLGSKDGAFGKPWDELRPYRVGGPLRNGAADAPISPLAVWPPPYDAIGPQAMVVSAHIHAGCVGRDGRAWAWGCGSNDGRCGVERFLNMKGEGRPPEVDAMKCYMMGPHRIGVARPLYWKHTSLDKHRVRMLATGRNHMAAIAVPDDAVR